MDKPIKFSNNQYSIIVYNHFNEATVKKIQETLTGFKISMRVAQLEEEQYFLLTYENNCSKNDFLNHLRNVMGNILKNMRLQLISVDFADAIGVITTKNDNMKPLGMTIKNVPFLSTTLEGDFIVRPKTLQECYDTMEIAYTNDKFEIVHAEFAIKLENDTLVVSVEKADRFPIVYAVTNNHVLIP